MSKKKASSTEQKENTTEQTPSPYERIFACRTNQRGALEFYVKLRGKSYKNSTWMSNEELSQNPQTTSMLTRFIRNQREYPMAPPYYDPQYDIIDRIITKKGKKYLVKWTGLGYDQTTWEKEVSKEAFDDFQKRSLFNYPSNSSDITKIPDFKNLERIVSYTLADTPLQPIQISTMNLLLNNFVKQKPTDITDQYNTKLSTACAAFLEYVLQNFPEENGPVLIVAPLVSTGKWYNSFRAINNATTIAYTGPKEARQVAVENDFYVSKKKLKFHVLITTPDILAHDIDILAEIKWRIAFFDEANRLKNPQSKLAKVLQQFAIGSQVALLQAQPNIIYLQKLTDLLISSYTDPFISEDAKKAAQIVRSRIQPRLLKRKNLATDEKESFTTYYIDCPLNMIQKKVLRKVIHEASKFVKRRNFVPLCQRILRICSHPFLLSAQEYTMNGVDFVSSSTKLQALEELLIENQERESNMMIFSEFSMMLDMVEDVANKHKIKFERIISQSKDVQNEEANVYLYNPCFCELSVSLFEKINTIVVIDGDGAHLSKLLLNNRPPRLHKIYKFQCRDCSESVLNNICVINPTIMPSDEQCESICKLSALAAFSEKMPPDPKTLLQKATVVENSFNPNETIEKEFSECDFWSYLVDPEDEVVKDSKENTSICFSVDDDDDGKHEWTSRERDQLLRGLCRFGFDRWRELIIQAGIKISIKTVVKASRALLREMLKFVGSGNGHVVTREFIKVSSDIEEDDETNDKDFINNSVFGETNFKSTLQKNTSMYLKEIEMLHFLAESAQNKNDIYEINLPHPTGNLPRWWTDKHDRCLVFATWKYGLGCYEQFVEDQNKEILEVFGNSDDPMNHRDLTDRVLKLADAIKRKRLTNQHINSNIGTINSTNNSNNANSNSNSSGRSELIVKKENSISSSNISKKKVENISQQQPNALYGSASSSKWTREESRDMFQYFLKYGMPEDKDGNRDYETFAKDSGLIKTKTVTQIQIYVDDYLEKCKLPPEEGGIPPNTSSRVNQRCAAMKQLREILRDEDNAMFVFESCPHWRYLPKEWNKFHESFYFRELLRLGFGSFEEILSNNEFQGIFKNNEPNAFLLKDTIVMKRIHNVYDWMIKNRDLRNKSSSVSSSNYSIKSQKDNKENDDNNNDNNDDDNNDDVNINNTTNNNYSSNIKYIDDDDDYDGDNNINTNKRRAASSKNSRRPKAKGTKSGRASPLSGSSSRSEDKKGKAIPPEGHVLQLNYKLFPSDRAIFDGRINYPLNIGDANLILNVGTIPFDKPQFHNDRYIYPLGYRSSSLFPSATQPDVMARWVNEITMDDSSKPLFRAWMELTPDKIYEGHTANAVWSNISNDIKEVNSGLRTVISGIDAFLLSNPSVTYLIQNMKGAKRCIKYKAKKITIPPEALKLREWVSPNKSTKQKSFFDEFEAEERYSAPASKRKRPARSKRSKNFEVEDEDEISYDDDEDEDDINEDTIMTATRKGKKVKKVEKDEKDNYDETEEITENTEGAGNADEEEEEEEDMSEEEINDGDDDANQDNEIATKNGSSNKVSAKYNKKEIKKNQSNGNNNEVNTVHDHNNNDLHNNYSQNDFNNDKHSDHHHYNNVQDSENMMTNHSPANQQQYLHLLPPPPPPPQYLQNKQEAKAQQEQQQTPHSPKEQTNEDN